MADLRTDYKDDLLDTSVNTQRKYRQVDNGDGTISFVDETVYTQNGDTFGASEVNQINAAVNLVNESLTVDTTNLRDDFSINALLQLLAEKYFANVTYLYKNGTEYVPFVTGTFETGATASKNAGNIVLSSTASFSGAYACTSEKVDLTDISTIIFAGTNTGGALSIRDNIPSDNTKLASDFVAVQWLNNGYELDVSAFVGEYYICLHTRNPQEGGTLNIVLEELLLKG